MNKHQNLQILPLINHYPLNFLIDYIYIIPCILFFIKNKISVSINYTTETSLAYHSDNLLKSNKKGIFGHCTNSIQ